MTREECVSLIRSIVSIYPNWRPDNLTDTVNTWFFVLAEYPAQLLMAALKSFALTNKTGFAPSPGQLVEQLNKDNDGNALEAWSLVHKAICNSGYRSKEEFDSLPPLVQRAVGSPENLRSWGMINSDSLTVIQANFVKTYNAVKEQEHRERVIPKNVRNLLSAASDQLSLEDKHG